MKIMAHNPYIYVVFVIFTGAALLATLALFTRQSLLVAYLIVGMLIGPTGLRLIPESHALQQAADFGIIFLLFLMGLHLKPANLFHMLKNATVVTLLSSTAFAALGTAGAYLLHFTMIESLIIGAAMMFSSTIIGLKLLPTTVLHHQHIGEVVISVLLLQDILAILTLISLQVASMGEFTIQDLLVLTVALPLVLVIAFLGERFILRVLISRFDRIREFIFLLAIAWCLGIAQLSEHLHLSYNIGAFIAGVSLASSPISLYIAESLKPLRDFFLILFFVGTGAEVPFHLLPQIMVPALILSAMILVAKPLIFSKLFNSIHESTDLSAEVAARLSQLSEFSLLIAYLALQAHLIGVEAAATLQTATLITFVVSSYWVVMKYPTPLASSARLRRD